MAYHFAQSEFVSRRALAASAIIALHVGVAYLLATGLIHTILPDATPRMAAWVDINRPPQQPPSVVVPGVKLTGPTFNPPPLPPQPIVLPESPPDVRPTTGMGPQPGELTAPATPPDIRVLGRNVLPSTVDYYPPGKRRAGIEGASYVRVCVDAQGVRQGEPQLERSSGDADLDGSALNMARHGRYARSLQGDLPVPNCYHFRIVFQIK